MVVSSTVYDRPWTTLLLHGQRLAPMQYSLSWWGGLSDDVDHFTLTLPDGAMNDPMVVDHDQVYTQESIAYACEGSWAFPLPRPGTFRWVNGQAVFP